MLIYTYRICTYIFCHIIMHTMSHHHTYYVTSSYMLCHISYLSHHHTCYVTYRICTYRFWPTLVTGDKWVTWGCDVGLSCAPTVSYPAYTYRVYTYIVWPTSVTSDSQHYCLLNLNPTVSYPAYTYRIYTYIVWPTLVTTLLLATLLAGTSMVGNGNCNVKETSEPALPTIMLVNCSCVLS